MTGLPFSSAAAAERCSAWMTTQIPCKDVRTYSLQPEDKRGCSEKYWTKWRTVHIVYFPPDRLSLAKAFWQHTGDGISSRRAEYCMKFFEHLSPSNGEDSIPSTSEIYENRGLKAKQAIRAKIASCLNPEPSSPAIHPDVDVFLHPSGMKAMFDTVRAILQGIQSSSCERLRMIAYGYVDDYH